LLAQEWVPQETAALAPSSDDNGVLTVLLHPAEDEFGRRIEHAEAWLGWPIAIASLAICWGMSQAGSANVCKELRISSSVLFWRQDLAERVKSRNDDDASAPDCGEPMLEGRHCPVDMERDR
jgi:hypothetical protein